MRTEKEIINLIMDTALKDENVRAVIRTKILNSKAKTTPYTNRPGIGIIIVSVKAINA